jgi:transposase
VIGRNNWIFADTVKGAEASANLYSLIETAKLNGLEPYFYLCRIFQELPIAKTLEDLKALLPWQVYMDAASASGVPNQAA